MTQYQTKTAFINALGGELARLRVADSDDILSDFEQHFTSGIVRGQNEAAICEDLGDPRDIALQYADVDLDAVPLHVDAPALDLEQSRQALKKSIKLDLKKELKDELTHELKLEDIPEDPVIPDISSIPDLPEMPVTPAFGEQAAAPGGSGSTIYAEKVTQKKHYTAKQQSSSQSYTDAEGKYHYNYSYEYNNNPKQPQPENNTQYTEYKGYSGTFSGASAGSGQQSSGTRYTQYRGYSGSYSDSTYSLNFNVGKIVGVLLIDLFVLSWAIPTLFSIFASVIVSLGAVLVGGAAMTVASVFEIIFGSTGNGLAALFSGLFGLGFGGLFFPLSLKLIFAGIGIIKRLINWHSDAFIGRPVFKPKGANV
jgi:uncharacterized membrane protein